MKSWIDSNRNIITIIFLGLIFGVNTLSDLIPDQKLTAIAELAFGRALDNKIEPLSIAIESLNGKLDMLTAESYQEMFAQIEKQGIKIANHQSDLYLPDLGYLLQRWKIIPEDIKTPRYQKIIKQMENIYYGGA
jgi:hypothetical protein